MGHLHRSDFLRELKLAFPDLTPDLNRQDGLLHFEMAVFRRHTQRAIDNGDREVVLACFTLAEKYINAGNAHMRDAIDVSYVEELEFRDSEVRRKWARPLLPTALRTRYDAFHGK